MKAVKTLWLLAMWLYSLLIGMAGMASGISRYFARKIYLTWSK